jgi:hypothetical protein
MLSTVPKAAAAEAKGMAVAVVVELTATVMVVMAQIEVKLPFLFGEVKGQGLLIVRSTVLNNKYCA